ncbi:hypothetical protein CWR48_03065 [Oceanobacillus arenosus]|uniref:RNA polymerase sigma-70 region 2 domain-containing protein n=1 Tax=Oceanobacillus arenosus TaxID=1229153 RepID=A0A3D8Q1W4_9BACI|nr:sigma-70 family RNA polymerase sigma factor [Oceanobacillus arenosus]RDW21399.1 hypothetical protein CWR48_03065 [Oceanobacillus arenosus]
MEKNTFTFEEIFEQNERRIHYYLHKLKIRDPHQEFYQEGMIAMWNAYEKYQPDKGPLSTFFNFTIRHHLIDIVRKDSRRQEMEVLAPKEEDTAFEAEVYHKASTPVSPGINTTEHIPSDLELWLRVKELLTEKQWKWVQYYIIEDMSLKDIAAQEGVSIEAVKSWAKEAKRRLRNVEFEKILVEGEYL